MQLTCHAFAARAGGGALFAAVAALAIGSPAPAQMGLDALIDRIGADNIPTGLDVIVAQVEANDGNGNYRPNPNHAEFDGKTFTLMSGPSGNSSHATTVGRHFFGLTTSVSPDVDEIFCFSAQGWITSDLLLTGSSTGTPPLPGPAGVKIYNNSWIADFGGATNSALRRADFLITRDDVLIISGVNNQEPQFPLMAALYNGLSIGRSGGGHAKSDTPANIDGPGRMKPELVAPHNLTSFATGLASSAAALMVETARTPPLDANPLAERSEVLKAALMGGATRGSNWTNNPARSGPDRGVTARPLDDEFGAGEINVNTAHLILTGKQQEGQTSPPDAAHLCRAGWDVATLASHETHFWRFRLPQPTQTLSVIATWHRAVSASNMDIWLSANIDLQLWRIDVDGNLESLIGEGGESYFNAGNVASQSAVDNVELLHVHDLAAGEYIIEVKRHDAGLPTDVAVAWLMDSAHRSADLTGSGSVGVADLLILLSNWGECIDGLPGCNGDLNCNGSVGVSDLLQLLSEWG